MGERGIKEEQYKEVLERVDAAWHAADGGTPLLGCCLCCAGCLTCGLCCPLFCCYLCISNKMDKSKRIAARAEMKRILDEFNGTIQDKGIVFSVAPSIEDMYIQIRFKDAEDDADADGGGKPPKEKNRDKAKEDEPEKEKEKEKSESEDDGDKGKGKVEDAKGTSLDGLD